MRNIETQTDVNNFEKSPQKSSDEVEEDKALFLHRLEELEVELQRKEDEIKELRQQLESSNNVRETDLDVVIEDCKNKDDLEGMIENRTNLNEQSCYASKDGSSGIGEDNIDNSSILKRKLVEKEEELEQKYATIAELKEKLVVLEAKLQYDSHEELREKLLLNEAELEEKSSCIGQLQNQLAMFEVKQGGIQYVDLVEELQEKLLVSEAELKEK